MFEAMLLEFPFYSSSDGRYNRDTRRRVSAPRNYKSVDKVKEQHVAVSAIKNGLWIATCHRYRYRPWRTHRCRPYSLSRVRQCVRLPSPLALLHWSTHLLSAISSNLSIWWFSFLISIRGRTRTNIGRRFMRFSDFLGDIWCVKLLASAILWRSRITREVNLEETFRSPFESFDAWRLVCSSNIQTNSAQEQT